MKYTSNEIEDISERLDVPIRLLEKEQYDFLKTSIYDKYIDPDLMGVFLWERFKNEMTSDVCDADAWLTIGKLVEEKQCILIIFDEQTAFEFQTPDDMINVISETYLLDDFYVTNYTCSYLICNNHHDYLSCCGSAKEKLLQIFK